MIVTELVTDLNLTIYSGISGLKRTVTGGYASDLLSDVMGSAKEGQVWITLQTHKNVMAVASLKDLAAIILVKGQKPDEDTMLMSQEYNIAILGSGEQSFELCGKIYNLINQKTR